MIYPPLPSPLEAFSFLWFLGLKLWLCKYSPQKFAVYKLHNLVSTIRETFYFRYGISFSSPLFIIATKNIPPIFFPVAWWPRSPKLLQAGCALTVSFPSPPCVSLPWGFHVFQWGLSPLDSWDNFASTNFFVSPFTHKCTRTLHVLGTLPPPCMHAPLILECCLPEK